MRLRKNKRAIELSVNFIVMLILAIAIFSGGLVFASKFFKKAGDIKGTLTSQTENQIEALLDDGSPVVIPIHTKEIYRKKFDVFGLGIMNSLYKVDTTFFFKIQFKRFVSKDKQTICGINDCNTKIRADPSIWCSDGGVGEAGITLEPNEKQSSVILCDIPAGIPSGSYLYTVTVYQTQIDDNHIYDAPLQIGVKVP